MKGRRSSSCLARVRFRLAGAAGVLLLMFVANAHQAQAYPQWQFTSGATRCNQCHYSPAGGGLPTGYGRDAVGEELSTFQGDGSFLHGAVELPTWIAAGADWRMAFLQHDAGDPGGATTAVFPMQLDAQVRLKFGDFSFMGIAGARAQARDTDAELAAGGFEATNDSRFVSREHWVMWQPAAQGPYARVGRFFAPFGLRLAEHVVTTRRDTGFNTLQETYNASAGYLADAWEAHLTSFGPDFLQAGTQETGIAGYYERRLLDDTLAVAGQFKVAADDGVKRAIVGAVGKYYVEAANLLVLAEVNAIDFIPDAGDSSIGLSAAAGAAILPVRGVMFTLLGERYQTDIGVSDTDINAVNGLLSWFPYPHFEIQMVGRYVMPAGQDGVPTFLAQFHYFL